MAAVSDSFAGRLTGIEQLAQHQAIRHRFTQLVKRLLVKGAFELFRHCANFKVLYRMLPEPENILVMFSRSDRVER
jgi:hypothetical protein